MEQKTTAKKLIMHRCKRGFSKGKFSVLTSARPWPPLWWLHISSKENGTPVKLTFSPSSRVVLVVRCSSMFKWKWKSFHWPCALLNSVTSCDLLLFPFDSWRQTGTVRQLPSNDGVVQRPVLPGIWELTAVQTRWDGRPLTEQWKNSRWTLTCPFRGTFTSHFAFKVTWTASGDLTLQLP